MILTGDTRRATVEATSKLNLFLEITARRPDGYHELETVMHEIDLGDTLTAEPGEGVTLQVEGDGVGAGPDNLVLRAAELLCAGPGRGRGARLRLTKRVPVGAGLGGGSADAAAALLVLDRLWDLRLGRDGLHAAAARLGSDVNFFLEGGTALCTGRGEIVEPVPDPPPMHFVLLTPGFPTLTADVYRAFSFDLTFPRAGARVFLDRLSAGTPDVLEACSVNRLESAALSAEPRLARVLACAQRRAPFGARVTGSGSTVWMPVRDRGEADRVVRDGELAAMGRLRAVRSARPPAGQVEMRCAP